MTILYDHSALLGERVLGTSNKTELRLGYGTIDRILDISRNFRK